jgi:mannose-6-phosphate isomerase-like protein (cupin superfamily)
MSPTVRSRVIRLAEARGLLPGPAGEHSLSLLRRGTADVKLAVAPAIPPTLLTPHAQDEIYVCVRGRGVLFHDGHRDTFEAGDLMLVAAGVEHRFEDYSEDLAVWVIFYGATGGEMPYSES